MYHWHNIFQQLRVRAFVNNVHMLLKTKAQANVIYVQTQNIEYEACIQNNKTRFLTVVEISATMVWSCEWYMKKNVLWFRVSELHRRKNRAIKINPRLLTLRRASARRVSTSRIKRWIITFVNRERVTAWRICNRDLQNFDNYTLNTWLKYSEMALVCAYFFISHINVLVIFGSPTLIVCHATKLL